MKAFGISNRNPGPAEAEYIKKWLEEYHFDLSILLEACARTLAAISQPSFAYADSILTVKGRCVNEHLDQDLEYDYLPDLVKLAQAHGAEAYRVIDPAKLEATLKKAVRSAKTTFVEVIVEPRANVYPMQPGGQPVEGMIFE